MLILPDGIDKTWAHQGSPSQARDEIAFMDAVRADLLARWPIEPDEILVTGFSQGGSMVWDLACQRGGDYGAFAAVSGAFWEPLPERCAGGPVDLLHIHGTTDRTVPMAGRPIGDRWRQGDVMQGLAVLRALDGCPTQPEPARRARRHGVPDLGRLRIRPRAAALRAWRRAPDARGLGRVWPTPGRAGCARRRGRIGRC